jgi:hypothetical protein
VNPVQSLLIFFGIPIAFGVVVYLLVSASSWTRSGRVSADYDADPFMVASDPAAPDPARLPSELAGPDVPVAGGGFSARW